MAFPATELPFHQQTVWRRNGGNFMPDAKFRFQRRTCMRAMLNSDLRDGLVDNSMQQREEIFPQFLMISSALQLQLMSRSDFRNGKSCTSLYHIRAPDASAAERRNLPPFPSDIIGTASLQLMLKSDFRDGMLQSCTTQQNTVGQGIVRIPWPLNFRSF